jgi:iron complex transport system permease protein
VARAGEPAPVEDQQALWANEPTRRGAAARGRAGIGQVVASWPVLIALMLGVIVLNVGLGAVRVDPHTIISVVVYKLGDLAGGVPGVTGLVDWLRNTVLIEADTRDTSVVWYIRLPRTLLGASVGAGLGIAGASLQGVFRNPLADPGLIGVSAGASVGAVTALALGVTWLGIWTGPAFGFVTALLVLGLVYVLARRGGRTEVVTLILAGVAISSVASGAVGWVTGMAQDARVGSVTFWQMGGLGAARWEQVGVVAAIASAGAIALIAVAPTLNLLALGEREARHLGVDVERLRAGIMVIVAAITAATVAFAGAIAFVGLVGPHLVRLACGPDHRQVVPKSAAIGAIMLMLADLTSRLAIAPVELPVGVVTGLIGGPFFAWLLVRTRKQQGGWA